MELQEIMRRYLGEIGRYQGFIIFLAYLRCIPDGMITIAPTFFAATPDHWCSFKRHNDVVNLTDDNWKRWGIPWNEKKGTFEQCQVYRWALESNWTAEEINNTLTRITSQEEYTINTTDIIYCKSWEFEHAFTSLVIDWNMVCGRTWMRSTIVSSYVIGWILGTHIFSQFADRYGRKRPLLLGICFLSIIHIVIPFCNNYIAFVFLRFATGFFNHGTGLLAYTYGMEAVGSRYRPWINGLFHFIWSTGIALAAAIAYLIRDWKVFMLVAYVPSAIVIIPMCFLPESLVWLADKGHSEEADKALQRMAKCNRKVLPNDIKLTAQSADKARTHLLDLIRTLTLLRITLIASLSWFVVAMMYFGILWNTSDLHGNLYLNTFIAGSMEMLCQLPNSFLVQKIGRRWTLCMTTTLSGVFFLITLGLHGVVHVVFIMGAMFFISMSFATVYQFAAELYPTAIRSLALSVMVFSGRVGTFVSPYLPLLGGTGLVCLCGTVGIVTGTLVLLLPETKDVPLPANVQDVQATGHLKFRNILRCPTGTHTNRSSREKELPESQALKETSTV